MTADTLGGVFSYAVELIRALRTCGADPVLATLGRPLSAAQRRQLSAIDGLEVHESAWALEWMNDPWRDIDASMAWLAELVQRVKPDILHLNQYAYGALTWPVPVLMVAHSCVCSWWLAVHSEPAPATFDEYRKRVRAGLRGADRVVAPSAALLASLQALYGPLQDAQVIPNGIDLSNYSVGIKQPHIITAGRFWDRAKNLAALQRAAHASEWPIYVAGETSGPDGDSHDCDPCLPLGALSRADLASQLACAAIYALPARYEPFGLSVLEAAAAGCALLLGRIPSLLENWQGAACFVDPDNDAEIARGLHELTVDHGYREQLAARARRRAADLSAASMADSYVAAYRSLISRAARGVRCAS
jgi:glycogen(starch) synthase